MTRIDIDWDYLGTGTLVPLATSAAAAVLLAASLWFAVLQEQNFARISDNQDVMNRDYNALILRKRLVDRYHRRYDHFRTHGVIGAESRLDWVETLRVAAEQLRLPTLSYALEPQVPALPPVPSTSVDSQIRIFLSRLELEVGLVHELDLLRLVDTLQTAAPGLIRIERCSMGRVSEQDSLQAVDPNIIATCAIEMISIVTSDVGVADPAVAQQAAADSLR